MEMIKTNNFTEMSACEMQRVEGGFAIAIVTIGTATYSITVGGVLGAIGTAWGAGKIAYEFYNAFFK